MTKFPREAVVGRLVGVLALVVLAGLVLLSRISAVGSIQPANEALGDAKAVPVISCETGQVTPSFTTANTLYGRGVRIRVVFSETGGYATSNFVWWFDGVEDANPMTAGVSIPHTFWQPYGTQQTYDVRVDGDSYSSEKYQVVIQTAQDGSRLAGYNVVSQSGGCSVVPVSKV